jgi:hypothetical protein
LCLTSDICSFFYLNYIREPILFAMLLGNNYDYLELIF